MELNTVSSPADGEREQKIIHSKALLSSLRPTVALPVTELTVRANVLTTFRL